MTTTIASVQRPARRLWLVFALLTTAFWGLWGAWIEIPEKAGFPPTLGYSVWALTMIPCAVVALRIQRWRLEYDAKAIGFGALIGLTGAGGQLLLYEVLKNSPAYLVFPIISLSPVVTIALSVAVLKERASRRQWAGIWLTLPCLILFAYTPSSGGGVGGYIWLVLAVAVFLAWGLQAYVIKLANMHMSAESIFVYMAISAVLLIPVALAMTDFAQPINWGMKGPYLASGIHLLNSIGALMLVYAFRHGKAIIVAPLTNALAPVITVIVSLILYSHLPTRIQLVGIACAITAAFLIAES